MDCGLRDGPGSGRWRAGRWCRLPAGQGPRAEQEERKGIPGCAAEWCQALRQLLPELPLGSLHALQPPAGHRPDRAADQGQPAVHHPKGRRRLEVGDQPDPGQGMVRCQPA